MMRVRGLALTLLLPAAACGGAPTPAPTAVAVAEPTARPPSADALPAGAPTFDTPRPPATDAERALAAIAVRLAEFPGTLTALTDPQADQRDLLRAAFLHALAGGTPPAILELLDAGGRVVAQDGVPIPIAGEWLDASGQVAWPQLRAALATPTRTIASTTLRDVPVDAAIASVLDASGAIVGVALVVR